jgi:hypothetical protein
MTMPQVITKLAFNIYNIIIVVVSVTVYVIVIISCLLQKLWPDGKRYQ